MLATCVHVCVCVQCICNIYTFMFVHSVCQSITHYSVFNFILIIISNAIHSLNFPLSNGKTDWMCFFTSFSSSRYAAKRREQKQNECPKNGNESVFGKFVCSTNLIDDFFFYFFFLPLLTANASTSIVFV